MSNANPPATLPFSLDELEALAGHNVFLRGLDYFEQGAVHALRVATSSASARVDGSSTYRTEVFLDKDGLDTSCTCPYAGDGGFCKHAVAVAVAWLAVLEAGEAEVIDQPEALENDVRVQRWLQRQSQPTLVRLFRDFANADDALMRRLLLRAEMDEHTGVDSLRGAIEETTFVDHYHWHSSASLAGDVENLVRMLEGLLNTEKVSALPELCEYAIARVETLLEQVDDSNGEFSWSLDALQALHFDACRQTRPAPLELARCLFEAELGARFDAFHESAIAYRELLGDEGLRHFQELARQHWQAVPANAERRKITHMMEYLARQSGDLDTLVAIKRQDLSSAYRYLDIASIFQEANRHEEALHWAQQGLAAFGTRDSRLVDFLAQRYQECGRSDDALTLAWRHFEAGPGLESYRMLKRHADVLSTWPEQRERALAWLETRLGPGQDQSLRLSIVLWEQDLDGAWDAVQKGPCQQFLRLELAAALENERPQDAVALYRPLIEQCVERTSNSAYDEAMKLIRRVDALMPAEESRRLRQLWRQCYKAKRNFISRLDALENRLDH